MTTSESCLHCHEGNKVQVSCDACHAFICVDCHWCHEFQANHEIRVCDRCDSFLCKDCEDMEQCHDCGEVVCKSCGNLLTCKFCGSSLCEECATACAKCGIVLCGRDAKFAVDCDTCKLSYCLVCLASGQKETCIRCHARPSKRMEQLVHLRLKSIYKAFQQSARTNDAHPHLKRAALAAMKTSKEPKIDPVVAKAQADAAAAELLAELEEEETKAQEAVQSKSKKKRKKKKKGGEHHEADAEKTTSEDLKKKMEASASSSHKTDTKKNGSATAKADQNSKKVPPNGESVSDKPPATPNVKQEEEKAAAAIQEEDLHQPDPMQTKLCELVNAEDTKGIEDLLEEWKGVPGKSALRKNAKKALKRLSCTTTSTNKPALKIISTTPKSTTTQETVMEMDPRIVGYVIGKGGQTIRDLMDESGAKVWIDQESMGTNEARVAYVSGAKKAVNIAVKMIQDLVREAEAPPPTTATQEADAPAAGEADPQDAAKPADGPLPPGWVREEITCEARFVPLLIGRRGWTIKHIQDASGAKVDIDQSVTPRIISLSGTPESVQTAKRLVSNVLSYPHDQLKNDGAIDETELFARGDGTHSPPPSSYVMTGDIKSIISASSSLSSTPEPSMASSKGRDFVMPPPGLFDNSNRGSDVPLAQRYSHPAYGETFAHQQQQQQAPPSQQNFAQMQQQPNLPPPGHAMVGNMQQHQQQQQQPPPHRGPPMMGPMPGMPPHMQQQQQPQLPMHHPHNQQPMPGGIHMNPGLMSQHRMTMQQQQQQMVMAQQRAASFMSHGNPNEASMRAGPGFGGMGALLSQGQQQQQNTQDLPDQLFRGAPESRGAGLLPESQRQALLPPGAFQPPAQQSNDPLGGIDLQVGNAGRLLQPAPIAAKSIMTPESVRPTKDILPVPISSTTQEESNLIDSLFAPSSGGGDESNLLAGLKGLSVGGNSWDGGAIPGWGETQEKSRLPVMQQSHPNESRFQWGS